MNEEKKDLDYWKNNCEEDYITTPISVLRYIGELEKAINKNSVIPNVSDIFCDKCKRITLNPTKASQHYCSCCGDKNYS